jgi:anti-anti-sigma factor
MPDTAAPLTLEIERDGDTAVVRCHGHLVWGVGDVLHGQVGPLLPQYRRVVLDLTDLTRMDSMGLGSLVRLYVSARAAGSTLELINLRQQIRMLLKTAHLLSAFSAAEDHGINVG